MSEQDEAASRQKADRHAENVKAIREFIDRVKMHRGPIENTTCVLAALAEIVLEDE